jgi:hypothetical protein
MGTSRLSDGCGTEGGSDLCQLRSEFYLVSTRSFEHLASGSIKLLPQSGKLLGTLGVFLAVESFQGTSDSLEPLDLCKYLFLEFQMEGQLLFYGLIAALCLEHVQVIAESFALLFDCRLEPTKNPNALVMNCR